MPQCTKLGHKENIVYFCVNNNCPKRFEEMCVQCLKDHGHFHNAYLLVENAFKFLQDISQQESKNTLEEAYEAIKQLKLKVLGLFENLENQLEKLKKEFDIQYHLQKLYEESLLNNLNKKKISLSELRNLIVKFNNYVLYDFEQSGTKTVKMKNFDDCLSDLQQINFSEIIRDVTDLNQFLLTLNTIKNQQLQIIPRLQDRAHEQTFILTSKPIGFSAISLAKFQFIGFYVPHLTLIERTRKNLEFRIAIYINNNNQLLHRQDFKFSHECLIKQHPTLIGKYLVTLSQPQILEEHQIFTLQISSKQNCSFYSYKNKCEQNIMKYLSDDLHPKNLIQQICNQFITDLLIRKVN